MGVVRVVKARINPIRYVDDEASGNPECKCEVCKCLNDTVEQRDTIEDLVDILVRIDQEATSHARVEYALELTAQGRDLLEILQDKRRKATIHIGEAIRIIDEMDRGSYGSGLWKETQRIKNMLYDAMEEV